MTDPRAAALTAAAQEIQDKSSAANMTLRTAIENFGRTDVQVTGNTSISFDTDMTQAEVESRLAETDIMSELANIFGAYPVVTVELEGNK